MPASNEERDWRQSWAFIEGFTKDWAGAPCHWTPDSGAARDTEQALGVALPPSVRAWQTFALSAESMQDWLAFRDIPVFERIRGHDAISILLQGEEDMYWGVAMASLGQDDPPVTAYVLDYDQPATTFVEKGRWAPSVSAFALDYLLSYLRSRGGSLSVRLSPQEEDQVLLGGELGEPMAFGHLRLYRSGDILAYATNNNINWHHGFLTVHLRTVHRRSQLPAFLRPLLARAHGVSGELTDLKASLRKPWWRFW